MRSHPSTGTLAVLSVATLFAAGCESGGGGSPTPLSVIVGSGIIVSEFRNLSPFDSIDVSIAETQIVITQGGPQSVWIETDDNIIDEIDMMVFGSVLQISSNVSYDTNHGVEIHLDRTSIRSLRLSGVGEIDAEALTARLADIELHGVGDCRITVTDQLKGTISGQGNIYYAGNPPDVIPNITGLGSLIPIP